jgi:hypothetical protein
MLYIVIERFKNQDLPAIGERFQLHGRMLPEGLLYHASWMDAAGARCFQLMETTDPSLLQQWIDLWADLVEFEVVPVLTSQEFWSRVNRPS